MADRIKNIGDFDGDGVSDLVACAGGDNDGGTSYGAFYIIFMKKDGTVKDKRKISKDSGNLKATFTNTSYFFGKSVVSMGDLDGDGVTDLAVGAAGANDYTGAVYILFMNSNATVKSYMLLDKNNSYLSSYLTGGNLFGNEVCNVGDVNGDDVTDLAVGASYENNNEGATYILFMKTDGSIKGLKRLDNGGSLYSYDLYGNTLANLGDLDGDGVPDLAIGCQGRNNNTGVVFITLLKSDGSIKGTTTINGTGKDAITTEYGSFGVGLSALKDIDGDGINDLLVGASTTDDGGSERGCAYVVCLTSDQHVKSFQKISYTAGMSSYIHNGDYFGSDVTVLDDNANDNQQHKKVTDTITRTIVVGARLDDDGAYDAGAFYIIKLKSPVTVEVETAVRSTDSKLQSISAYPNPFSGTANIAYTTTGGQVEITLSDINGRLIQNLQSGEQPAGEHNLKLDAVAMGLKPGIYLLQLMNNNSTSYVKLSVY